MASDNEASCASDPNFAVICSFLECFGKSCGIVYPDIACLQEMLENSQEVPQQLIDLHIKLLRKTRKTVSPEKWERALVKFCHTYSNQDGWELERFGYKKARIAVKLRLLKVLLETQFDLNQKFKNEVNKLAANELRVEPLGRDKSGLAYWCQLDEECNIRVYREDIDEENWELVAKDREGVASLISTLSNGEASAIPISEDSNSLEISEKPIIDTGQVTTSPSLEDETVHENGVHVEGSDEKELEKSGTEDFDEEQEQDDSNEADNDDDEDEMDDDMTNDDSSKQNTEEDDSQETTENQVIESKNTESHPSAALSVVKPVNGKVDSLDKQPVVSKEKEVAATQESVIAVTPDVKPVEVRKVEELTRTSSSKIEPEVLTPIKSIETPVITSPLKLVNALEAKQVHEEKCAAPVLPIAGTLSTSKKYEESTESVLKSLEKLSGKNNLTFSSSDMLTSHSKLSVKPIDQLAANLVRIQSEKLEKPSGAKSLEKIAENLARSGSIVGSVANGEDDRLPQDFCARSQTEKVSALRGHRGMDLSTSPRGWESANEQNRPMDFSGMDLSSRKFNKTVDLSSPGYRAQDFQHREMDLSTKKLNKPEVPTLPYDARAVMMRNHAMVADLSKRQMPFTAYEMSSAPYHNAARIPSKDEHRLPNYTILPDPSKITALRMNSASVKRPLEGDDAQQDMLKRLRADVIPIRGSMDKRPMMSSNWREEIGETIEEPVMMVQGEGSGSDCDAVNPGLSEAVEEPVIFFYGEGSGEECGTGNPGDDASADNKESSESKNEADSATASISPKKSLNEDSLMNEVSTESIVTNKTTVKLNRNFPQSSVNLKGNCQIVGSTQEKPKFKPTLGIQIIPKSASGSVKRLSRWDVGKPQEKTECDSSIISNEGDISPVRNAYDYEYHNAEHKVSLNDKQLQQPESECEGSTSASQDIKVDGNAVTAGHTPTEARNVELEIPEENAVDENPAEQKQSPVAQDSMQCDSSISSCQPDTSEALESCTEAVPKAHTVNSTAVESVCDSNPQESGIPEKVDNECKPIPSSPPRFFFGPNCISYTSKPEVSESQSDHVVSTTLHARPDTLQYGCVSSSKPVEDAIASYKSDDFDVTQTNNNSLKVSSFGTDDETCENDSNKEVEKVERQSNAWDQTASPDYSVEGHCANSKSEADLSNSESKVETESSIQSNTVQDFISSSENTKSDYLQPERIETSDAVLQPHSTNDLSPQMSSRDLTVKEESTSVEQPVKQCNLFIESTQYNITEHRSTFEEVSEKDRSEVVDKVDQTTKEPPVCSEDRVAQESSMYGAPMPGEDLGKTDLTTSANACSSSLAQNSQTDLNIREFGEENNFTESNPARADFPAYQEVDSSAEQAMEHISDKYQSFKKRESDSPTESCDKQSEKNDNLSEFDGQEEQSMDADNEKMKNLAGSDADSMCVNYDKNSERIDAMSDLGMQDEGSGDSEEIKEKNLDSFVKDSVPDANTETDFAGNSAVTSSESVPECNKDTLVPTISSSDDACVQDTSSRESTEVQIGSEKLDDTSSVKDEYPYSALPAIVPDTNTFKPSKSDIVETTKEISLSNLVQTANEYADDVSENRSSCVDQDSNEDMVIDDRSSESNGSSKEPEEVPITKEKTFFTETVTTDKDAMDSCLPSTKDDQTDALNVPETEEKEASCVDAQQKSPDTALVSTVSAGNEEVPQVLEPNASEDNEKVRETLESDVSENNEKNNQASESNVPEDKEQVGRVETEGTDQSIVENVREENQQKEEHFLSDPVESVHDKLQEEENITETPTPNQTTVSSTEHQNLPSDKLSLVANYDSNDSNDGSDDVFEFDATESTKGKTKLASKTEETTITENESIEELTEKSTEISMDAENMLSEEAAESKIEDDVTAGKEEEIVAEETPENEHSSCNKFQQDLKDKLVTVPSDNTSEVETEAVNAAIDSSKGSELTELANAIASSPVSSDVNSENACNQIAEDHVRPQSVDTNNLLEITKVDDESKYLTEKTTSEQVDDLNETDVVNEVGKLARTKENIEFNETSQITHVLKSKEQHLISMEEKSNLDTDINFLKGGRDTEDRLAEKPPMVSPYKKLKDFTEFGNKENKFDINLQEESHLSKESLEGIDVSVHAVSNILPLKLDNISSGIDKSQVCKNDIASISEDSKSLEKLHFADVAAAKPENQNALDNHERTESLNAIDKTVETFHKNAVTNVNDSAEICARQEEVPETIVAKNDGKKETSKRLSDTRDIQDVPSLKSKPPSYTESGEKILEDLTSSEVQLDKNLDSFKQIETSVTEPEVTERVADAPVEQLSKDNFDTNTNLTGSISKVAEEGNALQNEEKKESAEIQSVEVKEDAVESDDSMGVDNECLFDTAAEEVDPLAYTDDDDTLKRLGDNAQDDLPKIGIRVKPVSELVYEGWKLDSTETPKISRKRRNSSHESNSEDVGGKQEDEEAMGGKRIKLRGKRIPDKQLRKSVEDSRVVTISSEDEAVKCSPEKVEEEEVKDVSDDHALPHDAAAETKSRGRPRGRRRRGHRGNRQNRQKHSKFRSNQVAEGLEVGHLDGTPSNNDSLGMTPPSQKKRKKRKMVLGLEIGRDIAPEVESGLAQDEAPVRQSRRIAQLKIKEEADKRRFEEEGLCELKEKKDSAEKKKRKKQKPQSEEEVVIQDLEKEQKSKKKRKKRKKKKMLAKFNEANPWQSSSGSSSDEENENDDDEDDDDDIESEGSLLFKSDHEFSPESDLEKDQESEPLRRARTAQKAQSDVEEADDEYACQKCGKADHPEWILLCDSCDKGWHCSCLRPALMLIPEGDWFCPPCQHNLLVTKLQESLKTFDQLTKRHENEVLRKKRLAFVGISLDNVLHKSESQRQKGSKASSQESDNETTSTSTSSSSETSSSEESEPVYQLRERRCANTYKFNEYDDMINAAIQDEVEAVQGAGNQGRGKDIATIVNAEKEEAQLHFKDEDLSSMQEIPEDRDTIERKSEKDSDEEYKIEGDDLMDDDDDEPKEVSKKLLSRKKHRKLNSLDISSEDDPDSDEDFKGTSSDDEEDFEDHLTSSDESSFSDVKRRSRKGGDSRPVRRCTRARTTRYDDGFINDDSDEESYRPKRKKSRSTWGDSDSEEDSDNSWRQSKKKSRTLPTTRCRPLPKMKSKKKKKRKRIIEFDNQSDNEDEDDSRAEEQCEERSQLREDTDPTLHGTLDAKLDNNINDENNGNETNSEMKDEKMGEITTEMPSVPIPPMEEVVPQKKKKENTPKPKKAPGIRRKIIYGGLPDDNFKQEEEETLGRRTRGRKINYQEEIASDSEEELKKALRKTGESEDEFVVNEGEDMNEDAEKDSDSGDIYNPKKDGPKFKNKSPKSRRPRKSKSPGGKRRSMSDGTPKQRKKPGPKPGSKNKARKQKFMIGSVIKTRDDQDGERDVMAHVMDNPMGDIDSKIDDNLSENVGLSGTTMSVAGSFTGDVPEGSLTGLGPGELADLDDEQLEQMMMEDEEYGRRQLELAAIEIAKKKKKEEREAKKLEKARLKALEILAAERQRDPNAPEGTDGETPKKKKRGRRSKAEILAEQMRRDGAPNLSATNLPAGTLPQNITTNLSPNVNPNISAVMTPDAERTSEGHIPMMTGPDGQLFNPDGSPMKPKRRGRGKGKKTLALEAARAAEAAAKAAAEAGLLGMGTDSNPEMKPNDVPNVLPTPGSSTSGSAPSTPPASGVTTQGPPSTQSSNSQSVYPSLPPSQQSSVITRMLQSQPVSSTQQSFTAAAAAMGHKYFGGPNAAGQMMGGPRTGYEMQPRSRIPSPYRQPGQTSMPPHFAAVRSGTPPMRLRVPGPQMYHTPHHPMDPSPSGGGPISINNRDRSSPLGPGPAMIPPAAGSPLAKGGPTPPPPPPYVRGGPALSRFADNPMAPRHQMPPFTNTSPANHNMQQPSPPPNRPPGNFSPYHPPPPPNYHYGAYPPPPPMSTADDAAAYQGSPYPAEHFSSPADNQPPIQAPPPPQPTSQPQQAHPNEPVPGNKQYDEEGTGEFGGLVSYFSSQREDDLDS